MNNEPITPSTTPTEPTPPQPTAEPPITPQPITSVPPTPQTDPITFTPDPFSPPKKKSKLPLIIGSVLGVLLVATAAFGIFWYINYQNPETVALEAIDKFVHAKNVQVSGTATVRLGNTPYGIETVQLSLNVPTAIIPTSAVGTLTIGTSEDEFSIGLGGVIVQNGTVYFQAEGIVEALDGTIPAELAPFIDLFEAELSEFDGQWYELDVVEVAAILGATISEQGYTCTLDAVKTLASAPSRNILAESYKQNPFVTLEKTNKSENGATGYTTSLSTKHLTSFVNHIKNSTTFLDPIEDCIGSTNTANLKSSTNDISVPDLPNITLYISDWGHELRAIKTSSQNESFSHSSTLNFTYPDSITVATPENTLPLSDFLEPLMQKLRPLL